MRLVLMTPVIALVAAMMLVPRGASAAATTPASVVLLGKAVSSAGSAHVDKAGVGFHLYIGPRYRRYRRYHRPRRYRRYYRGRHYGRGRRYGRCGYWRKRCARNWGYGGSNFRGCLRYHGCR
jgi:hypothetical protein